MKEKKKSLVFGRLSLDLSTFDYKKIRKKDIKNEKNAKSDFTKRKKISFFLKKICIYRFFFVSLHYFSPDREILDTKYSIQGGVKH